MQTLADRLGEVIRQHRLAAGMSQEELAHRADLHPVYISLLERGQRNVTAAALVRLGEALGASGSELLAQAERPAASVPAPDEGG